MKTNRKALWVMALAAVAGHACANVAYDNTTTMVGTSTAGGATLQINNNTITNMLFDDITVAPGFGGQTLTSFKLVFNNANTFSVVANAHIAAWAEDGSGGGPGTFLFGGELARHTFAPGVDPFQTHDISAFGWAIPTSGKLWLGVAFDNVNGTSGADANALNNLGFALFSPPTVGSSNNGGFVAPGSGDTEGSGYFGFNNPPGTTVFFDGNPLANEGITLNVAPEPGTLVVLGVGIASLLKRRRK